MVPDDRVRETREIEDWGFEAPVLPELLPREHLEPQEARAGPKPPAVQPPAQRRRKPLILVPALLLVLIEAGWIVAIAYSSTEPCPRARRRLPASPSNE